MNDKLDPIARSSHTTSREDGQNIGLRSRLEGNRSTTPVDPVPVGKGDSNRASQVLNEARLLAALLHHKEFLVAHLLLTIARTADGVQLLQRWKVDPANVNLLCWRALENEDTRNDGKRNEGDPSSRVIVSADIMLVHGRAGAIAAERGESVIEFNDLVEALVASRISARFFHLYGADVADLTRDIVKSLQSKLDKVQKTQKLGFSLLAVVIAAAVLCWVAVTRL